jgi:hypothetical protein
MIWEPQGRHDLYNTDVNTHYGTLGDSLQTSAFGKYMLPDHFPRVDDTQEALPGRRSNLLYIEVLAGVLSFDSALAFLIYLCQAHDSYSSRRLGEYLCVEQTIGVAEGHFICRLQCYPIK